MSDETCPDCGRPYSADYKSWLQSDVHCGMSRKWNEDGEHEDCVNECLYATRTRLRAQLADAERRLAQAERVIAAADRMRNHVDGSRSPGFTANQEYDTERAKMKATHADGKPSIVVLERRAAAFSDLRDAWYGPGSESDWLEFCQDFDWLPLDVRDAVTKER